MPGNFRLSLRLETGLDICHFIPRAPLQKIIRVSFLNFPPPRTPTHRSNPIFYFFCCRQGGAGVRSAERRVRVHRHRSPPLVEDDRGLQGPAALLRHSSFSHCSGTVVCKFPSPVTDTNRTRTYFCPKLTSKTGVFWALQQLFSLKAGCSLCACTLVCI